MQCYVYIDFLKEFPISKMIHFMTGHLIIQNRFFCSEVFLWYSTASIPSTQCWWWGDGVDTQILPNSEQMW